MSTPFSSAVIFEIKKEMINRDALEEALKKHQFHPCGPSDEFSLGWVAPLGEESTELVHSVMNVHFIVLKTEKKSVPGSVLKEECRKAESKWKKENQSDTVPRQTRREIKEKTKAALLEKAFSKTGHTWCFLDATNEIMCVATGSRKRAEDVRAHFVKCSGLAGFPVKNIETLHNPANIMSHWLAYEQMPAGWLLGSKCNLRDVSEDGTISYRKLELVDGHVQKYLQEDKVVTSLQVRIGDRVSVVVAEDLSFQGIKLHDIEQVEPGIEPGDGAANAGLDAELLIASSEIAKMHAATLAVFGGIVAQDEPPVADPAPQEQEAKVAA